MSVNSSEIDVNEAMRNPEYRKLLWNAYQGEQRRFKVAQEFGLNVFDPEDRSKFLKLEEQGKMIDLDFRTEEGMKTALEYKRSAVSRGFDATGEGIFKSYAELRNQNEMQAQLKKQRGRASNILAGAQGDQSGMSSSRRTLMGS